MKQFIISLTLLMFVSFAHAQDKNNYNPYPKTISVNGSAEMEIVPDEIYVQIDLHEYKKKGGDKVELDKIKNDFLSLCKQLGISDSTISIASYDGNNGNYIYWKKKKTDPSLFATIAYQIKFKESRTMDKLVNELDDDATANFQIVKVSHSNIQAFRKQLKIDAIKAAKEKGIYLTASIEEKLGNAVTIEEPEENTASDNYSQVNIYANKLRSVGTEGDAASAGVDFKKIKLRYEVKVVFALM